MKKYLIVSCFTLILYGQKPDFNTGIKGAPFLSVKANPTSVKGDGTTNDTIGLQAAIDNACAIGGQVLYLNAGTYIIAPTTPANFIFTLCSNIHITGPGILKIKSSSGSFYGVFGYKSTGFSNVIIDDITIDWNSSLNPLVSSADLILYPRIAIKTGNISVGTNNVFKNIHLTNPRAEWAIFVTSTNSSIINNLVDNIGGGTVDYDSSILYTESGSSGAIVSGNKIIGSARNAFVAKSAIETHDTVVISGNQVQDMLSGIQLVGAAAATIDGITVTGNTIKGVYNCIQLWSSSGLGASGFGLRNTNVNGNVCVINQRSYLTVGGAMGGIFLNPNAILPFGNIKINNNLITFDASSTNTDPIDQASIGVGYWDSTNANSVVNGDFSGNTVIQAPASAFRFSANGININFDNLIAINPGSSPSTLVSAFRSGFLLGNPLALGGNLSIKNAMIIDNQATSRFGYGINLGSAAGPNNVRFEGTITCVDLTCTSLQNAIANSTNDTAIIHAVVNVPSAKVLSSPAAAVQSTIFSVQDGINYLWDGSVWSYVKPHPTIPHSTSGCGTGWAINGSDRAGVITLGTSASTTCTITFGTAFLTQPYGSMNLTSAVGGVTYTNYATTTTTLAIAGTNLSSNTFMWNLVGN